MGWGLLREELALNMFIAMEWRNVSALLCALGALLVRSWCALGALYQCALGALLIVVFTFVSRTQVLGEFVICALMRSWYLFTDENCERCFTFFEKGPNRYRSSESGAPEWRDIEKWRWFVFADDERRFLEANKWTNMKCALMRSYALSTGDLRSKCNDFGRYFWV